MATKILKINTRLSVIPEWLKINNSIVAPLPMKTAKELARKLLEIEEDVEIELSFSSGKKTTVEIKFDPKNEEKKSESASDASKA